MGLDVFFVKQDGECDAGLGIIQKNTAIGLYLGLACSNLGSSVRFIENSHSGLHCP